MKIILKESLFYKNICGKYVGFKGYLFNYGGVDFAICNNCPRWAITHLQTGMAINSASGNTRKECIHNLIKVFPYPEKCKEMFKQTVVKSAIEKYGINPLYNSMDENLKPDFFINFINMGRTINI